jgi:Heat induced stress protein YflT
MDKPYFLLFTPRKLFPLLLNRVSIFCTHYQQTKREMEAITMSKTVLGVYNSSDEVIQAIEVFQNEGYSRKDFSIIANTADIPSTIKEEKGVASQEITTRNNPPSEEHLGFLASLFTPFVDNTAQVDGRNTYYDHLIAQGISEADALKYEQDINSGMILLLAEKATTDSNSVNIDRF